MRYDLQPPSGNTVTRRLRITAPLERAAAEQLAERLGAIGGVSALELTGCELRVDYDFTRIGLDGLAREMAEAGIALDESGWRRLRGAWYRFVDGNARDNAHFTPTCCSQPPRGAGRRNR